MAARRVGEEVKDLALEGVLAAWGGVEKEREVPALGAR